MKTVRAYRVTGDGLVELGHRLIPTRGLGDVTEWYCTCRPGLRVGDRERVLHAGQATAQPLETAAAGTETAR